MRSSLQGAGLTSARRRKVMVKRLRRHGVKDPAVLEAMYTVPRHLFVDEAIAHRAYEDVVLPIGHRQTISNPMLVGVMTELVAEVPARGSVLEVGTGCGYQTAILAQLFERVFTIERIGPLAEGARARFESLGLNNIEQRIGDGQLGLANAAPFDAVIVTAAARMVPEPLLDELHEHGRMVIPVGESDVQELLLYRQVEGAWQATNITLVRFVPLLSGVVSA